MIRLIFCILIIACFGCTKKKVNYNGDLVLKAEIIGRNSCPGDFDHAIITMIVKNNSRSVKSFWIMKCSWEESFRTDNDSVIFCMRTCLSNFPIDIVLNFNDSIQFISVLQYKRPWARPFRVGLIMLEENDFFNFDKKFNRKYIESRPTYWSQPISFGYSSLGYKYND